VPEQTYANHRRLVPGYHGLGASCVIAFLVWSLWRAVSHPGMASAMQVVLAVGVASVFWYSRVFALTLQDRLIGIEERARLERILPTDLRPRIPEFTRGQLVALRFASDGELPSLARRVLEEGLRDRDAIKQLIVQWRPDHFRV
jgi:hypothetical protein